MESALSSGTVHLGQDASTVPRMYDPGHEPQHVLPPLHHQHHQPGRLLGHRESRWEMREDLAMRRIVIPALAALAFMACDNMTFIIGPPPSGYTQEAWDRLKRKDENFARTISWINSDPKRRRVREIYLEKIWGLEPPIEPADSILSGFAENEFVRGVPDGFRKGFADSLRRRGESYRERGTDDYQKYLDAAKEIEAL